MEQGITIFVIGAVMKKLSKPKNNSHQSVLDNTINWADGSDKDTLKLGF